jgi:Trypsin-co-occurring domain 2
VSAAQTAGMGQAVQFRTGPVELEVAVTHTRGGEGGVQIWVLTLGGKLERERENTQRIKVTLHPVDRFTGQDAQIGDISQGSGSDEPPP